MAIKEFRLPDLGEGLTESELVSWRVSEGDTVTLNQVIAEVETAKALVELPSPHAGVISRLYVDAGVTVNVGDPIVAFEIAESETAALEEEIPPNLVGYGAIAEPSGAPARRVRNLGSSTAPTPGQPAVELPATQPAAQPAAEAAPAVPARRSTPPVRQLAQQLGIDIESVNGTGESGLVTRADIERAVVERTDDISPEVKPATVVSGALAPEATIVPVKGIHRLMADAMVSSAFTAPHVTMFLTVDVTNTVEMLDQLRGSAEFRDRRLTFLVAVSRAVCLAIRRHPEINSRWDEATTSIIRYRQVGLGIAAATPRGLIVPNIARADDLDLAGLADRLTELVGTAKAGRTSPAELSGGTFTISNIGVFGVDAGTPILNNGEAAILAVGAVVRRPWEHDNQIALRHVVTLSLSIDHRVLDGAEGSKFLSRVGQLLSDPAQAFTWA